MRLSQEGATLKAQPWTGEKNMAKDKSKMGGKDLLREREGFIQRKVRDEKVTV